MKIAILGFAGEGHAAFEYWNTDGNDITVCDLTSEVGVPKEVKAQLGPAYLQNLDSFDLLVRTPSLHPKDIVAANPESPTILSKVTTGTNEFMRVSPSKNIIAVTGTKGKGTTSTLIAKMLEAAGKRVHLGGNIGIPPLDMLKNNIQTDDWVVLELSNFQLIDLKSSPAIATCLMVEPEHLNWHADIDEYVDAKRQLFRHQSENDLAVYYANNRYSLSIAEASPGILIPFMATPGANVVEEESVIIEGTEICKVSDIRLLGEHNWQNVCAAVTVAWQITHDAVSIKKAITGFTGLPHRLEFVAEIDGVKYYDDSFGTTPDTAIVAIEAFKQPKVIILGGSDKEANYGMLASAIKKNTIRAVLVIGQTGPAIAESLRKAGVDNIIDGGSSMDQIIRTASQQAQPGDIVLLSTACASFGLFKNYKDRGEQFKQAVQALALAGQ